MKELEACLSEVVSVRETIPVNFGGIRKGGWVKLFVFGHVDRRTVISSRTGLPPKQTLGADWHSPKSVIWKALERETRPSASAFYTLASRFEIHLRGALLES